jgi:acetyl esterase/lipase
MTKSQLDPQAAEQLALMAAALTIGGSDESVGAQRLLVKRVLAGLTDQDLHHFAGAIEDLVVSADDEREVAVRRYEPREAMPGAGVVYFHGGGWVFGDLDTGDRLARAVARRLGVTVVSVDYRRAPENSYPAALRDCVLVAERARDEFDLWCAIAGDSAGGNLAIATSLSAPIARQYDAQLLLYPCLDAEMTGQSYETYADGYGLTREIMQYYWTAYSGGRSLADPLLSPQLASSLHDMPPTVLAIAGFDVLFDENQRFAQRLISAGVDLTYLPFMSLPHGFVDLVDRVDAARFAVDRILLGLKSLLSAAALSGAR